MKKKSKLARGKENPRSNYWRTKADTLWSEIIRSAGVCMINNGDCKGRLDPHHLINRSVGTMRHNLCVGVCLCSFHHVFSPRLSAHGAPLAFADWLQRNEPERWQFCQEHKYDTSKPDYKAAYEFLNQIKETQ